MTAWGLPNPHDHLLRSFGTYGEPVQPKNLVFNLFIAVTQPPQPPSVTCNGARVRPGSTTQRE